MATEGLRIASCQFPISGDIRENARYIRRYLEAAADTGAHLLHTPETCLSGYYWHHFPDTIPDNGWTHNKIPLRLAKNQEMWFGKPSTHPRQVNGRSEP